MAEWETFWRNLDKKKYGNIDCEVIISALRKRFPKFCKIKYVGVLEKIVKFVISQDQSSVSWDNWSQIPKRFGKFDAFLEQIILNVLDSKNNFRFWFHGEVSKEKAKDVLDYIDADGFYMVRYGNGHAFTIMYMTKNSKKELKVYSKFIYRIKGGYSTNQTEITPETLPEIIEKNIYMKTALLSPLRNIRKVIPATCFKCYVCPMCSVRSCS